MSHSHHHSAGFGFAGLLTIVFVLLKAFGKIDWPWWLVFAPLWINAALVVVVFGVLVIVAWKMT